MKLKPTKAVSFFALITQLLFLQYSLAKEPVPYIRYMNTNDGLSTPIIRCIEEDNNGNIWFGNQIEGKGFDIYDGKNIRNWTDVQNRWLAGNILDTHKLSNGNIIILYQNFGNRGSIAIMNPLSRTIEYYHELTGSDGKSMDLKKIKFNDFSIDKQEQNVWLITNQKKLYKITLNENKIPENIEFVPTPMDISKTKYARSDIFIDSKNNIWLSHGKYLFCKEKGSKSFIKLENSSSSVSFMVRGVIENDKNRIVVNTNNGLFIVKGKKLERVFTDKKHPLYSKYIFNIYQDELNQYWLATSDGLCKLSSLEKDAKYLVVAPELAGKTFYTIKGDSFGGIWFSVNIVGVGYINLYDSSFGYIVPDNTTKKDIAVEYFYKDNKGAQWMLTEKGLTIYDPKTDKYHHYNRENKESKTTFPQTEAIGMFQAKDGTMWIYFINLYLCKVIGNEYDKLTFDWRYLNMKQVRNISGIVEDKRGDFWISSIDLGISKYTPRQYKLQKFENPELKQRSISILGDYESDKIWVGTPKNGVHKISLKPDGSIEKIFTYKVQPDATKKGRSIPVRNLRRDNKGRIWGVNRHADIFYLENENSDFQKISDKTPLPKKLIRNIIVDDNSIWLVANHLHYLDLETNTLKSFNHNITRNNLFGKYGVFKDKDNNVYFTGTKGVNFSNKSLLKKTPYIPLLYLSSLKVSGKEIKVGEKINERILLEEKLQNTSDITLLYEESELSISAKGIYPPSASQLNYYYKLEGLHTDWLVSSDGILNFGTIPTGQYELKVYAEDNKKHRSKEITLNIQILAPWWETAWFRLLVIALVFIIPLLIYKRKVAVHKRNAKRLEGLVKERTKEISTKNEELLQQSEELEQQRDYLFIANKEISTKNELITSSLKYAKTIQNAILPTDEQWFDNTSDHFVLYQPKDIVSGDFYWLAKEGNKTFIACIDCTGHGVPGAFMSMIGNSTLNQVVKEQRETSPKKILTELNIRIKNALKQESGKNDDGMDLSLLVFESHGENIKVTFAGAKNDLFYCRQGDNKISVLKGSRKAIGGLSKANKEFTEDDIFFSKGDSIYLFTDGIIDICNPERKRFGKQRLFSILEENLDKSMDIQCDTLLEEMTTYQQDEPQRDDITVIGIKL